MIYGIGTDICDIRRIRASLERHGERFAEKILSEAELATWRQRSARWPERGVRYLATRFSSKEAFSKAHDDKVPGGKLMELVKRFFTTVDEYYGTKLSIVQQGKRYLTPLMLVMISIGATDVLFALDSIPAVYGLTDEAYIVFTANAFALLGLRQLYFLLSGLMQRLKYLGVGLSIILAWIGVKLVNHALHKNELPFINGGEHVELIPEISTELSLAVIIVTLIVTTVASLLVTREKPAKN